MYETPRSIPIYEQIRTTYLRNYSCILLHTNKISKILLTYLVSILRPFLGVFSDPKGV